MSRPLVSVILPAFNAEDFLAEAISSVLAQKMNDFELIVIDDGSVDTTLGIATDVAEKDERISVRQQENAGAGAARNAGLAAAKGQYAAFIDADDVWHVDLLGKSVTGLQSSPDTKMIFPRCRYVDEAGRPLGIESVADQQRYEWRDLLIDNPIHSGSGVMVRRADIVAAGGFDETLTSCIDLDCWLRVVGGRTRGIVNIPEILVDYRRRSGQITADWRRMERGWKIAAAKTEKAGLVLTPQEKRMAAARLSLAWAGTSYAAGEYRDARALTRRMWRADPGFALRDGRARIRTLAALASLLPKRAHHAIRDIFNRRR